MAAPVSQELKPTEVSGGVQVTGEQATLPPSGEALKQQGYLSEPPSLAPPTIGPNTPASLAGSTIPFPNEKLGTGIEVEDKALTRREKLGLSDSGLWMSMLEKKKAQINMYAT